MRFTLHVIPCDPETQSILAPTGPEAIISGGNTGFVYVCGSCEAILVRDFPPKNLPNIIIKCFGCGACNEASVVPGYN